MKELVGLGRGALVREGARGPLRRRGAWPSSVASSSEALVRGLVEELVALVRGLIEELVALVALARGLIEELVALVRGPRAAEDQQTKGARGNWSFRDLYGSLAGLAGMGVQES